MFVTWRRYLSILLALSFLFHTGPFLFVVWQAFHQHWWCSRHTKNFLVWRLSQRSHVLSQVNVVELLNVFSINGWHTRLLHFESSNALKLTIHFFFFSPCGFTMFESPRTCLWVVDGGKRHTSVQFTQFSLHVPFSLFIAHSVCYYSVTVTKEGLLYWQGMNKFTCFCAMKFLCTIIARWYLILSTLF